MINSFNLFCENLNSDRKLNWIIDKMSKFGETSLSSDEKEFLNNYKEGKPIPINISSHYNKYILSLLSDVKNGNITDKIAKKFIEKHIDKEDLSEFLLSLLKDGKLDSLINLHDIND